MSTVQGSGAQGSTINGTTPNAVKFSSFLKSGDYSDLTIKTQTGEHHGHKIVLCAQSPFFTKAVKKDTFEEGRTNIINMKTDNPQAVACTLDYLYRGSYNCALENTNDHVLLHIDVFVLADKVGILALKTYAIQFVTTTLSTLFGSPADYVALLKHAYNSAPPGSAGRALRTLVVEQIKCHGQATFTGLNRGFFRELLFEVPELAADLSESLTNDLHRTHPISGRRG